MVTSPQSNKVVYLPYEATGVLASLGGIREMLAGPAGRKRDEARWNARGVVVAAVFLTATRPPCRALPACDSDNGGITCPRAFAPSWSRTRWGPRGTWRVASNGDLFVALAGRRGGAGGILALRDTSGDGKADVQQTSAAKAAPASRLGKGALYLAPPPPCIATRCARASLRPARCPGRDRQGPARRRPQRQELGARPRRPARSS